MAKKITIIALKINALYHFLFQVQLMHYKKPVKESFHFSQTVFKWTPNHTASGITDSGLWSLCHNQAGRKNCVFVTCFCHMMQETVCFSWFVINLISNRSRIIHGRIEIWNFSLSFQLDISLVPCTHSWDIN